MPSTSTQVRYLWRDDCDLPAERPDITAPDFTLCSQQTPQDVDGDWYACDLANGHTGPHAAFAPYVHRPLIAVWEDARPSEADRRGARIRKAQRDHPTWSFAACMRYVDDQYDEYAADEAGAQ